MVALQNEFETFAVRKVAPQAGRIDREESLPAELVSEMAGSGFLGSFLPSEWGGQALDMVDYGILHEEIGRFCSSTRSLLTVHDMVAHAILKYGSREQRSRWLPELASGSTIAAFAVSEPNVGSDPSAVETTARRVGRGFVLNGVKRWISFGRIAGLLLVLARLEGQPEAFLVEARSPGLSIEPIAGLVGLRGSMAAELHFDDCEIGGDCRLGRPGFGGILVVLGALGLGRYSVACGCVGIVRACLEASLAYAAERRQFGKALREHQLIQAMIAEMSVNLKAARLLCREVGRLKQQRDPSEIAETFVAKYFASQAAVKASTDAVQIHGANGCAGGYPVERFWRDARVMEIIEGSSEIQKITIADHAFREA